MLDTAILILETTALLILEWSRWKPTEVNEEKVGEKRVQKEKVKLKPYEIDVNVIDLDAYIIHKTEASIRFDPDEHNLLDDLFFTIDFDDE